MRRIFLCVFMVSLLLGGFFNSPAKALVFDLNCILEWDGPQGDEFYDGKPVFDFFGPTTSFGKISFSLNQDQSLDRVQVDVDLIDGFQDDSSKPLKVIEFLFNYNDSKFANDPFKVISDSIDVRENSLQADGYTDGNFDLLIPDGGNLGFEPYSNIISLDDTGLSPDDFDFKDSTSPSGKYFAVVHIGNFASGFGGADSIWIGACGDGGGGGTGNPVPEPATMLLLGIGIFGLGATCRKKFMK